MREVHVRIPDAHLDQLTRLAKLDDRTTAYLIRRAVRLYLQNDEIFASHDTSHPGIQGGLELAANP